MTVQYHIDRSRKFGHYSAVCLVAAIAAVAVVLILAVHRGLWPPPARNQPTHAGHS